MCNVIGENPKREPMHERALPALYLYGTFDTAGKLAD
jgi:hypothetical protein